MITVLERTRLKDLAAANGATPSLAMAGTRRQP